MTAIPSCSSRDVRRALERAGFTVIRNRDHIRLARGGVKVSLPHQKQTMHLRTVLLILKQTGITTEQFVELLKD